MAWDPIWEDIFSSREWGKYPSESLIRFMARNFYKKDRGSVKVLEIGCGPGANVWYLARERFDTYGIDASPTAIEHATKRLKQESLSANLVVGDIEKLPFKDAFFDCVVDSECLSCNSIEPTRKIVSEVSRVLKPGGLFYSRSFTEKMVSEGGVSAGKPLEFHRFSEGGLSNIGFIRLIDRPGIADLYGRDLKVISIDKLEYTSDNGRDLDSEYLIICAKN